jgi:hypothetical protein
MFSLSFDSSHRVLLAQFEGVLSSKDINGLDKALAAFVSRHGSAPGIVDFSSIEANAVPQSFFVWRARLPQILLGQERIIVAPQQEIYELACAYAAQQRDFGNVEPQVVRTLGDAYLALDLKQPDFRPVLTATDYLSQ